MRERALPVRPLMAPLVRPLMLLALLLWLALPARAQDVLPVPPLSGRVIDQTATLGAAQAQALSDKLAAFEAEAGPQIVLLLVPTTAPEDIAAYAQRVADSWKIGRSEVGDGVLLVVAVADRKVRIEVAKALEGAIPDLAARQIIDRHIRPAFRADDYAGGLNAAVDALIARVKGEDLPLPAGRDGALGNPGPDLHDLGIFLFVAVPVIGTVLRTIFGRKLGTLLTSGAAGGIAWVLSASLLIAGGVALLALLVVGLLGLGRTARRVGGGTAIGGWGAGGGWSGGGGGWSGGGGGGGGFSSGGGGDFGGGGASGGW